VSLRNTQKPLAGLLASRELATVIVAVPAGELPASVITATYDAGLMQPLSSNKAGNLGALSPIDGSSLNPADADASAVEYVTREFLIKLGECAHCNSDLYADNATANAMQEYAFSGACVMCGNSVSYFNTGELAHINTKVGDGISTETANHFDFTELLTVDPNKLEENDMSNKQARAALRASVADTLRTCITAASDEDETVAVEPEDDEDFAEESEDDSQLEVMDMDESDPADEDDDSDGDDDENVTDDEEAATNTKDALTDSEGGTNEEKASDMTIQTDPASEAAPTGETAPVVENVANVEAPASEIAEEVTEEAPADTVETPATVLASDEVSTDTVIEYVATTPANISPDAELVAVSETAIYIVQDAAPVAVLNKEHASAGAQTLWHKPVELRNAFRAGMTIDKETALANFGGKVLSHKTTVAGVIAERITREEQAAASEIAADRLNLQTRFSNCLEIAALGMVKGMFGADYANPIAAELADVLEVNGVREPKAIITASMIQSAPKFVEMLLEKASSLMGESDDSLSAKATMIGTSDFIAPVVVKATPVTPETPVAAAPVETASVKTSKVDISKLFSTVGRSAHV